MYIYIYAHKASFQNVQSRSPEQVCEHLPVVRTRFCCSQTSSSLLATSLLAVRKRRHPGPRKPFPGCSQPCLLQIPGLNINSRNK